MKQALRLSWLLLASVPGLLLPSRLAAEEWVTIPKTRLEELERKEAELERLKQEIQKARAETQRLQTEQQRLEAEAAELRKARDTAEQHAAALAATASAAGLDTNLPHATPPIASLPPLKPGAVVDATDLAAHYRTEPAAAARRYETGLIHVRGQAVRFEKPPFLRHYVIHLRAAGPDRTVACRVYPPDTYAAVFPAKGGQELVATTSAGARFVIARLGETVVVRGRCKGLREGIVWLGDATLLGRAE
jgi:hypothetical protein